MPVLVLERELGGGGGGLALSCFFMTKEGLGAEEVCKL